MRKEHEVAVKKLKEQLSSELERERETARKERRAEVERVKKEGDNEVERVRREGKAELERVRRSVEEERAKEEKDMRDRKLKNMSELKETVRHDIPIVASGFNFCSLWSAEGRRGGGRGQTGRGERRQPSSHPTENSVGERERGGKAEARGRQITTRTY